VSSNYINLPINQSAEGAENVFNVHAYGAQGDGVADDTSAIQATINAASTTGGGVVYFPTGTYKTTAVINMAAKIILQGDGENSSLITSTHTGDSFNMSSPINSSTGVYNSVRDLYIKNTNGSNVGAGYDDVGGTYITMRNVKIEGFKYGVILDQSELVHISDCEFKSNLLGGVWLVNGAEHTPLAQKEFTNRISIESCQFNQGATAYGIIDDGGTSHTFKDNNYNGCLHHIFSCDSHGCSIIGGEFEGAVGACIIFDYQTLSGGSGGQGLAAVISGADIQPVSGQSAISIVSHKRLSLIGNAFGGNGTPTAVVGLGNLNSLFSAGNDNISFTGTPGTQFSSDDSGGKLLGAVNLASVSASQAVVTDSSKNLASLAYTDANTVSTLVKRDGSGNFSAGTITASLTGNVTGFASPTWNYTSQTTTYSAVINDYVICSGSSFTVTLPTAASLNGKMIAIQHNGSSSLDKVYTLNTTSAQTIGGIASGAYKLFTIGEVLVLVSDGSNWVIVNHQTKSAPVSYSPTLSNTDVVATSSFIWYRSQDGAFCIIDGQITFNGVGAAGALTFTLPGGSSMATSLLPGGTNTGNGTGSLMGHGQWWDQATAWKVLFPKYASTTTIGFTDVNQQFANNEAKNGSSLNFNIKVPISSWQT
jgi:hypothetical protein